MRVHIGGIWGPGWCGAWEPAFSLPFPPLSKKGGQTPLNRLTSVQWSLTEQLEDLDLMICLYWLTKHQQLQETSGKREETAALLGLKIKSKTKVMRINNKNNNHGPKLTRGCEQLHIPRSHRFSRRWHGARCLGQDQKGKDYIQHAQRYRQIKTSQSKTKLQIFNSNVKTTRLYGS